MRYSFLRQRPIYRYIVDFYCPKLKLVIEIDGDSHRNKFESDRARQRDLESLGLQVLRIPDRDVKHDMRNVLVCIQNWIQQRKEEHLGTSPYAPFKRGNKLVPPARHYYSSLLLRFWATPVSILDLCFWI